MPEIGTILLVIVMAVVSIVISVLINSAILFTVLRLLKMRKSYKKALKIAAIAGVVMFFAGQLLTGLSVASGKVGAIGAVLFVIIPGLTYIVNIIVMKKLLNLERKKVLITGLAWTLPGWVISGIVVRVVLSMLAGGSGQDTLSILVE